MRSIELRCAIAHRRISRFRVWSFGPSRNDDLSRHARALDADGHPIAGLYAAGNDMASIMGGNYPGAGITLGPALTFGYIAGKHIAGVAA